MTVGTRLGDIVGKYVGSTDTVGRGFGCGVGKLLGPGNGAEVGRPEGERDGGTVGLVDGYGVLVGSKVG